MDYEMLISCLNVLVFMITIAYSMYFFTCFRTMVMYNQEPDVPVMKMEESSLSLSLLDTEINYFHSSDTTPLP